MAKQTFSAVLSSTTDAEFRAWGSTISGVFSALMTKVTQSGEINWSTVLKPTGASVSMGFEVYRFTDALHATYPLFLKFEYGSGGSASYPGMYLTVGKTVDGSGNVGGVIFPRTAIVAWSNPIATTTTSYASSGPDNSAICLALAPASADSYSKASVLVVERSRDSAGNATGAGFVVQYNTIAVNPSVCKVASYTNATLTTLPNGMFFIPFNLSSNVSVAFGTNSPFFTGTVINPDGVSWIPKCAVGVAQANLGVGQVVTAMFSGNDYLGLGIGVTRCDSAAQTYSSMAMIWM